jgi:hypothetical protein
MPEHDQQHEPCRQASKGTLVEGNGSPIEESASMPEFDIRDWMRRHNVTLPVNDPAVRKEISALLRRDLNERLGAYAEQSRQNRDQSVRRNQDAPERTESASA